MATTAKKKPAKAAVKTAAKKAPAKKAPAKKAPVAAKAAAPVVAAPVRERAPAVLKLEHLTMRFGGLVAVDDLSFEARRGEITALIGPNGAGKTTVFNCITGFYKPTTGLISLDQPGGKTFYLDRMPDFRVCAEAKVARTFQNIRLFSGMTILENLLVAQHNHLMVA
ncbi:MAG: ATP-binding cassette domain-containing protein, partial [Aestuariivirgaceae bacterium]|nr:ATP-binding cassette domain-containing protein [Aestuariivirgaceae bacterium]